MAPGAQLPPITILGDVGGILAGLASFGLLVWSVGRNYADRRDVLRITIAHYIDARMHPTVWRTVITCVNRSEHSVHVSGYGLQEVVSGQRSQMNLRLPEQLGSHRRMRELEIQSNALRVAGIDGTAPMKGFIVLDDGSVHYSRPNPIAPVAGDASMPGHGNVMSGGWHRLVTRGAVPSAGVGVASAVVAILVWDTPIGVRLAFVLGSALLIGASGRRILRLIRSRTKARDPGSLLARAIVAASYGSEERYILLAGLGIAAGGLVALAAGVVGTLVLVTADSSWRGFEVFASIIGGSALALATLLALTTVQLGASSRRVIAPGDLGPLPPRGRPRRGARP
jgi:hypothetical protein